jgi:hypothetical protein
VFLHDVPMKRAELVLVVLGAAVLREAHMDVRVFTGREELRRQDADLVVAVLGFWSASVQGCSSMGGDGLTCIGHDGSDLDDQQTSVIGIQKLMSNAKAKLRECSLSLM